MSIGVAPNALTVAHKRSLQVSDCELVSDLIAVLGTRVLAQLIGKDPSTVSRWKAGTSRLPDQAGRTFRLVYQIVQLLETEEADSTIRAWFLGMNPQLDDATPVDAVRTGQHRDVMAAARAFLTTAA